MLWAREMGVTSAQDIIGKQLPLVTAPEWELGEDWLHAMGPHLPRLTMAAQQSWKNLGMLVRVTDCRRNRKWDCRGRLVLEFKLRPFSHTGERIMRFWQRRGREDHEASAEWGCCGGDTTDGAGSLNYRLLLFLRYGTQAWAEGDRRTVCICGYSKGL